MDPVRGVTNRLSWEALSQNRQSLLPLAVRGTILELKKASKDVVLKSLLNFSRPLYLLQSARQVPPVVTFSGAISYCLYDGRIAV